VQIKWPNDIYAGKEKIAGILVEHSIIGKRIERSILGIGLNINQEIFPDNIPNPVSLKQLIGCDLQLEEITDLLLHFLGRRLNQLEKGRDELIRNDYLKQLYRYKEFAPYRVKNNWFRARIVDVKRYGHLVLETEDDKKLEFGFKEIEFIED